MHFEKERNLSPLEVADIVGTDKISAIVKENNSIKEKSESALEQLERCLEGEARSIEGSSVQR